ncbi:MAG TPA: pyridoxamine 5'-phosphate oxidase [Cellvibrionaceae bacterium]
MTPKLEDLRREYLRGGLRRDDLTADPVSQFNAWFEQVMAADVCDPTAMVLATVDAQGQPSQRIVLLKQLDDSGFVFYTNTTSRKGRELAVNPRASLLFPWHALERQVKVCGQVEPLSRDSAQTYFASRPRESQLAAWASDQSTVIGSRQALLSRFNDAANRFGEGEVPLPDNWGGYRVVPHEVEFWQGGAHRLHDCFRYQKTDAGQWQIERLAP